MQPHQRRFVDLALARSALRFGRFTLKSGRESPYFFNAGLFNDGESLASVRVECLATWPAADAIVDYLRAEIWSSCPMTVVVESIEALGADTRRPIAGDSRALT